MPDERRREPSRRIQLRQRITLITSDGLALCVTLQDLSRDGFKIEHDGEDLIVGEVVVVRAGRSEARAQISWATEREAGGKFLDDADMGNPFGLD
jgi:hypothetical protein